MSLSCKSISLSVQLAEITHACRKSRSRWQFSDGPADGSLQNSESSYTFVQSSETTNCLRCELMFKLFLRQCKHKFPANGTRSVRFMYGTLSKVDLQVASPSASLNVKFMPTLAIGEISRMKKLAIDSSNCFNCRDYRFPVEILVFLLRHRCAFERKIFITLSQNDDDVWFNFSRDNTLSNVSKWKLISILKLFGVSMIGELCWGECPVRLCHEVS